jgi:hypothetical protein
MTQSERANADHPKIRKLYHKFLIERIKKHLSVPKIIGDKRAHIQAADHPQLQATKDIPLHSGCESDASPRSVRSCLAAVSVSP